MAYYEDEYLTEKTTISRIAKLHTAQIEVTAVDTRDQYGITYSVTGDIYPSAEGASWISTNYALISILCGPLHWGIISLFKLET